MKLTESALRRVISEMITMGGDGDHRCFDGTLVPFGSDECLADLDARMTDARSMRDGASCGTDTRAYLNGMLHMLRKKTRSARKENELLNPPAVELPEEEGLNLEILLDPEQE